MIKFGITGDKNYRNKNKIINLINYLKSNHGPTVKICSGGTSEGADLYVRKYSIELGMPYGEFNPAFSGHKMFSVLNEDYYKGKEQYHFTHLLDRFTKMSRMTEAIYIFLSNDKNIPTDIQHLINICQKNKKKYKLLK